ncbi:hypothetical protein [uncultured Moraxella sp.]|uniref:hypothetical protein n=1 Tax=uncultured Moraxella sp. TaxID=263769 RepID=UPI0025F0B099|nr:hypothetical protein [uncultured Moraxella sp.]
MSNESAQKTSYTLPILASVLIHVVIVIAIMAPMISPPDKDVGIQTTLASQEAFAKAQSALNAHHQAQNSAHTKSSQSTANAQTAFGSTDNPYQSNRVVNSTTTIEPSFSTDTQSLGFDQPSSTIDNTSSNFATNTNDNSSAADTGSASNNQLGSQGGVSAADKKAAQQTVYNRIKSIWLSQPKQPNQMMQFVVRFDEMGNVAGIDFGAGNPELKDSIRTAVQSGAPYPEIAGLVGQMTFQFQTETLIYDEPSADASSDTAITP